MRTTFVVAVVLLGTVLFAPACERSAEDEAMQAAQQGRMVSMGPGGREGEGLDKVAPFPKRSAFEGQLRPPEVDPAAIPGKPQLLRWDLSKRPDRVYAYDHHVELGMRMLDKGLKSSADTSAEIRLSTGGDGQAAVRLERGTIKAKVQKAGSPPESGTDAFGPLDLGRMGADAGWIGDVQAQGALVALLFALPKEPVATGKSQRVAVQLPLDAGGEQTMLPGEAELTPVGFLEADGHRCALLRIAADLEQKDTQAEPRPGQPAKVRMAIKAKGWSLFDTVDRNVRRAELAVYLGMRTLVPVTPQMRAAMCKKTSKRIPDEVCMQVDADNFVTLALQQAE